MCNVSFFPRIIILEYRKWFKMSCIEQLQIKSPPSWRCFVRAVQKRGIVLTMNEAHELGQEQNKLIILGTVLHVSNVIERSRWQLFIIHLLEVTADSHKGKFFSVFAFNNFATSLADASLQKGDFIAFRSPYIEQNTRHSIEQNCHGLQVRMGIPPRTGAKIFFVRNSKNFRTSPSLSRICLERLPAASTVDREPPPSPLGRHHAPDIAETLCDSPMALPLTPVSNRDSPNRKTSSPVSSALSTIPPSHTSSRPLHIQSSLGGSAMSLQNSQIMVSDNFGTSQSLSRTCLERLPAPSTIDREPPPSPLGRHHAPDIAETQCDSPTVLPLPPVSNRDSQNHNTSTPVSSASSPLRTNVPASSTVPPSHTTSTPLHVQSSVGGSAVASQNLQTLVLTYKRISELVEPESRVNMYGVISSITKMPTESTKHAVITVKDETCGLNQHFRVHIFSRKEKNFPKIDHGYILRLHRMKTELFDGVLDGRVFRASDIVTFPPDGQGMAGSYSTAESFSFCDSDASRLAELRRWIASINKQ